MIKHYDQVNIEKEGFIEACYSGWCGSIMAAAARQQVADTVLELERVNASISNQKQGTERVNWEERTPL